MKNKKVKINEYNILGVIVQALLTFLILVFLILSLIISKKYFLFMEIVVVLDLLIMAYNNKMIYKRDKMTKIYVVFSIIMIMYILMTVLGVK